jgi:hypothetical protein
MLGASVALMIFGSLFGAVVLFSGENVLETQLLRRFSAFPGFDASLIASWGATSILGSLSVSPREAGIEKYNEAPRVVFLVGLIPSCLSVLGAALLGWRSVKKLHMDAELSGTKIDTKE